jgi:hypothetical protein
MVDYNSLFELEQRNQRKSSRLLWFLAFLLPVMALVGFLSYQLMPGFLSVTAAQPTPTATFTQTSAPSPEPTLTPAPTSTVTATTTPVQSSAKNGWLDWSQVTMQKVGESLCVQGKPLRNYRRKDGTRVMVFSEDPGAFQVWANSKPFEWYLKDPAADCVQACGWVLTSGVRPIILLDQGGRLDPCP